MSKQQHTRGPWKSRHKDYAIWDGNGCRWVVVTAPKRGEIARFKKDADAILASSASELLEAAEHCRELLMRYEINRVNGEEIADEAIAKLNAAIAKARGES